MASTAEAIPYASHASASKDTRLSALHKESKVFSDRFRSLIESADARPSSNNVEFARKELRNVYLKMLFHFTFSGRTRGIEGSLWMETTHPLVHLYRSQLSMLESKIRKLKETKPSSNGNGRAAQQGGQKKANQNQLAQLMQSHDKLASSFRVFLENEEGFWRDLAGRLTKLYNVRDAMPNLRALNILSDSGDQEASTTGIDRIIGLDGLTAEYQVQARLPGNRSRLIEIVHKSLIYCGDLARYIVLYADETQGQHHAVKPSSRGSSRGRGRGRGGGREPAQIASHQDGKVLKDFKRAASCYEQARHLVPSNGNPWNQLAVLATYRGENLVFVYDSYRALCVSEPFDKARGNMEKTLRKILDKWLEKGSLKAYLESDNEQQDEVANAAAKALSLTSLSRDLVVLHSAYFLRHQSTLCSRFPVRCMNDIYILIQRKALPTDLIVQITVSAIAALWLRRLWRGNSPTSKDSGIASSLMVEQSILLHLCNLIQTMFDIGANEAIESIAYSNQQAEQSEVQDIPAVLRRMLPAIRIISKWLKAHLEYIAKSRQQSTLQSSLSSDQTESATSAASAKAYAQTALGIDSVWNSYANFINAIRFAYPFDDLPSLGTSVGQSGMSGIDFEEDRDMRGFSPMKKSALVDTGAELQTKDRTPAIRPKEEHLIRIADILIDAKVIAETEGSPVHFDDAKSSFYFVRPGDSQLSSRVVAAPVDAGSMLKQESPAVQRPAREASVEDDSFDASESSEDAVDLAMRAVDERRQALASELDYNQSGIVDEQGGEEEEDDEDEIILIPSARQAAVHASIATPERSKPSRSAAPELSGHADPLNAQHLLLQVLNGSPRNVTSTLAQADASRIPSTNRASSRPLSATGFPASSTFGPIGTPLPRATPSPNAYPQSSQGNAGINVWANATESGLINQQHQHRTDIWAPQSTSGLAQQAQPASATNPNWPATGSFHSGLRDWVGTTTAPTHASSEEAQRKQQSASGQQW